MQIGGRKWKLPQHGQCHKRDGYIIQDPSEFVESVRKSSEGARRPFTIPGIRSVIEVGRPGVEKPGLIRRIYLVNMRVLGLLSFLALSGTTALRAIEPPSNEPTNGYEFRWGLRIPTRDGTKLNATAYLPIKKEDGTLLKEPTVLLLTPYVSDSYHAVASYFAQRGYGFLLVDCRGRGNSEGRFDPLMGDANDAYDIVEWAAGQDR